MHHKTDSETENNNGAGKWIGHRFLTESQTETIDIYCNFHRVVLGDGVGVGQCNWTINDYIKVYMLLKYLVGSCSTLRLLIGCICLHHSQLGSCNLLHQSRTDQQDTVYNVKPQGQSNNHLDIAGENAILSVYFIVMATTFRKYSSLPKPLD